MRDQRDVVVARQPQEAGTATPQHRQAVRELGPVNIQKRVVELTDE